MRLSLLFETIDRLLSPRDDDMIDVAAAYAKYKNTKWDSGITPKMVVKHIESNGRLHKEIAGSDDLATVIAYTDILGKTPNAYPVLVDDDDIVDGYHRLTAAYLIKMQDIPYNWL